VQPRVGTGSKDIQSARFPQGIKKSPPLGPAIPRPAEENIIQVGKAFYDHAEPCLTTAPRAPTTTTTKTLCSGDELSNELSHDSHTVSFLSLKVEAAFSCDTPPFVSGLHM
jgi:hypothetical protein